MSILERSEASGGRVLDKHEREKLVGHSGGEASEREAAAVAKAIGLPGTFLLEERAKRLSDTDVGDGSPLSRVTSAKSDYTSGPESPSPTGGLGPDESFPRAMRSPASETLESPEMSDEDEDEGSEGEDVVNRA